MIITDEDYDTKLKLSGETFKNNPNLKSVRLRGGKSNLQVELPEDLFSENPLMEEIELNGYFQIPENTFAHLQKLETLRLKKDRKWEDHIIVLHESSPQYNLIIYGSDHPSGWKLVESE